MDVYNLVSMIYFCVCQIFFLKFTQIHNYVIIFKPVNSYPRKVIKFSIAFAKLERVLSFAKVWAEETDIK